MVPELAIDKKLDLRALLSENCGFELACLKSHTFTPSEEDDASVSSSTLVMPEILASWAEILPTGFNSAERSVKPPLLVDTAMAAPEAPSKRRKESVHVSAGASHERRKEEDMLTWIVCRR